MDSILLKTPEVSELATQTANQILELAKNTKGISKPIAELMIQVMLEPDLKPGIRVTNQYSGHQNVLITDRLSEVENLLLIELFDLRIAGQLVDQSIKEPLLRLLLSVIEKDESAPIKKVSLEPSFSPGRVSRSFPGPDYAKAKIMINEDLRDELRLEDNLTVFTQNPEYIKQIAGTERIYSCYPTSILNGWIHQGVITQEEAVNIQTMFLSKYKKYFGPSYDNPSMLVWDQRPDVFMKLAQLELEKDIRLFSLLKSSATKEEMTKMILSQLHREHVIVSGDKLHAVLVTGYRNGGSELIIRNPLDPSKETYRNTLDFAQDVLDSDKTLVAVAGEIS